MIIVTKLQFLQVANDFFRGKDNARSICPEGIRLFCLLEEHRQVYYENRIVTSIDILSCLFKIRNRDQRTKVRIRELLMELQDKKYISMSYERKIMTYNTPLFITKPTKIEGGFAKVDPMYYYDLPDPDEFAMMCVMVKNREWKRYQVSQDELAASIQCERKKAANVAERLRDKGMIFIQAGGWYTTPDGQVRKEVNTYKTRADYKVNNQEAVQLETQLVEAEVLTQPTDNGVAVKLKQDQSPVSKIKEFDKGRWVADGEFPQYEDYVIYRENIGKDAHFDNRIKKRIEGIRKKDSQLIYGWKEQYEKDLPRLKRNKARALVDKSHEPVVELADGSIALYRQEIDVSQVIRLYDYWWVSNYMYTENVFESMDVANVPAQKVKRALTFLSEHHGRCSDYMVKEALRADEWNPKENAPNYRPPSLKLVESDQRTKPQYKKKKSRFDISEFLND